MRAVLSAAVPVDRPLSQLARQRGVCVESGRQLDRVRRHDDELRSRRALLGELAPERIDLASCDTSTHVGDMKIAAFTIIQARPGFAETFAFKNPDHSDPVKR